MFMTGLNMFVVGNMVVLGKTHSGMLFSVCQIKASVSVCLRVCVCVGVMCVGVRARACVCVCVYLTP